MKRLFLASLSVVLIAGSASGIEAKKSHLKWMAGPPGLPAGGTFAVVSGDPAKAGMFSIRFKMPANYAVPPHHHATDEKVSVLSGTMDYGMGDKVDRANAGTLNKGYHINLQAGMNHWAATGDTPATIQVTAMGPFSIIYANPADDPRTKK